MKIIIFLLSQLYLANLYGHFEQPMVVLIPSYNNEAWCKKNLDSVFNQNYSNFKVIYIDDASSDKTSEIVRRYIKDNQLEHKIKFIQNSHRLKAMENLYKAIHLYCLDNEVVVKLDGDDWFAHENVLARINKEYINGNTWATYGNYVDEPNPFENNFQFCKPIDQLGSMRDYETCGAHTPGHPFTFYSSLFKKIKLKHILYEGVMPSVGYDGFMNFPMFEMARFHIKFIPEILYIHNVLNPINDFRVNGSEQEKLGRCNASRKPYKTISNLNLNNKKHIDIVITSSLTDKMRLLVNNLKQNYIIKNTYTNIELFTSHLKKSSGSIQNHKSEYVLLIQRDSDFYKKTNTNLIISLLENTKADYFCLDPYKVEVKWNKIDKMFLFKTFRDIYDKMLFFKSNIICKKTKLYKLLSSCDIKSFDALIDSLAASVKEDDVVISYDQSII